MSVMFCGDCGTPRPTPEHRFCAECGAPYEQAPTGPQPVQPVQHTQPDYSEPAVLPADPDAPRKRRSRAGTVLGVGALVLAVGGAGIVGWQVFGPKGGADSPDAAASQFMDAVADQDGVALLSVVNPGEVEGLDDVYSSARERLEKEGLVDGGGLSEAVDVSFEDLAFEVDELGDGVARVTLTDGSMTASYDPAALPDRLAFVADDYPEKQSETVDLAKVLDEADDEEYCDYDDYDGEEYDCRVEESGLELGLTTVEVDGRWYVSLLGTAADLVYQDASSYSQVRRPDYDAAAEKVDPVVGKDPEDVVENLVEAVNDQDVDALLDQLPADLTIGLRPTPERSARRSRTTACTPRSTSRTSTWTPRTSATTACA